MFSKAFSTEDHANSLALLIHQSLFGSKIMKKNYLSSILVELNGSKHFDALARFAIDKNLENALNGHFLHPPCSVCSLGKWYFYSHHQTKCLYVYFLTINIIFPSAKLPNKNGVVYIVINFSA